MPATNKAKGKSAPFLIMDEYTPDAQSTDDHLEAALRATQWRLNKSEELVADERYARALLIAVALDRGWSMSRLAYALKVSRSRAGQLAQAARKANPRPEV